MKVRITFEITDVERMVIGLAEAGEHRPATRDEMVSFIHRAVMAYTLPKVRIYEARTEELVDKIRDQLEDPKEK